MPLLLTMSSRPPSERTRAASPVHGSCIGPKTRRQAFAPASKEGAVAGAASAATDSEASREAASESTGEEGTPEDWEAVDDGRVPASLFFEQASRKNEHHAIRRIARQRVTFEEPKPLGGGPPTMAPCRVLWRGTTIPLGDLRETVPGDPITRFAENWADRGSFHYGRPHGTTSKAQRATRRGDSILARVPCGPQRSASRRARERAQAGAGRRRPTLGHRRPPRGRRARGP